MVSLLTGNNSSTSTEDLARFRWINNWISPLQIKLRFWVFVLSKDLFWVQREEEQAHYWEFKTNFRWTKLRFEISFDGFVRLEVEHLSGEIDVTDLHDMKRGKKISIWLFIFCSKRSQTEEPDRGIDILWRYTSLARLGRRWLCITNWFDCIFSRSEI